MITFINGASETNRKMIINYKKYITWHLRRDIAQSPLMRIHLIFTNIFWVK